jgi:hypothetical protein
MRRRGAVIAVALAGLATVGAGATAIGTTGTVAGASRDDDWRAGASHASRAADSRTDASRAAAPRIRQLVVFRDGSTVSKTVSPRATRVRVEGRRCTAGDGTALAGLVRSRPGRLRLRDFGACSLRARDGGGLFVQAIRGDRNRGQNGWVYKVGRRAATAGAADPAGPLGRGRLRAGQRVTWFYCRLRDGGCQRTLELIWRAEPGTLVATVRGYDDDARGVPVEGATVRAGGAEALTDATGEARLPLPPGRYRAFAEKPGLVRSFTERVEVP